MRAYYLHDDAEIGAETLTEEGILYWQLSSEEAEYAADLAAIRDDRGYVQMDQIYLGPETPNLDALCNKFFVEHSHADEEIRFVVGGSGIFDLRDKDDRWMRVHVEAGDLVIVPAGKHHRFTLDDAQTITCKRLFKDTSGWQAIARV